MNIYIRQSKKNTKNIIIQSLHFVNLVKFLEQLDVYKRQADMFDVSLASVQQWIRNYESIGANAFKMCIRDRLYTEGLQPVLCIRC